MNVSEWDPIASKWDRATQNGNWFHKYIIYPSILNIIGNPKGRKVVDIGCGTGHLAYMLHSKGAIVTGIDKSGEMIHICRQHHPEIQFEKMDVTEKCVFHSEFDYAIFNNSLQDMQHYKAGIYNAREMLNKKGSLIIVIKHPCFHPRAEENGWKIVFDNDGHYGITGYGLTSLLEEKEKFSGLYYSMDNYYSRESHTRIWYGESTESFTRTLEEYTGTIISSGFIIKGIYEPRPLSDGKSEHECLYNLLQRIPNFLMINAIRSDDS